MYALRTTTKFRKNYKKVQKRGFKREELEFVVEQLMNGKTLATKYHDHALTGEFKGFRECHIRPDWLLIYLIDDDVLVLTLTNTGTHADLFGL